MTSTFAQPFSKSFQQSFLRKEIHTHNGERVEGMQVIAIKWIFYTCWLVMTAVCITWYFCGQDTTLLVLHNAKCNNTQNYLMERFLIELCFKNGYITCKELWRREIDEKEGMWHFAFTFQDKLISWFLICCLNNKKCKLGYITGK